MSLQDPGIRLKIWNLPSTATQWDVTREIAMVLHSGVFGNFNRARPLNFGVKLNMSDKGGIRNDGTGILTLPFKKSGIIFLNCVQSNPIKIEKRKLRFSSSKRPPKSDVVRTLARTPYLRPDVIETHQETLRALEGLIRVNVLQFGVFFCDKYPCEIPSFSVEWERKCDGAECYASLSFQYDDKLLLVELGSQIHDLHGYNILIRFSSIHKIHVPTDGRPYICFELLAPPALEQYPFHRMLTGDPRIDNEKFKSRVASLDDKHKIVSPYAPHLRLELTNQKDLELFTRMCVTAKIAPAIVHIRIQNFKKEFFTTWRLDKLKGVFKNFHLSVAFQLEALLCNGLLNTDELDEILPRVDCIWKKHSSAYVGELLRRYIQALQGRTSCECPQKIFRETASEFEYSESATFRCCHVTVTPTRLLLDGPYPIEENRVIRQYPDHKAHFIRVDFRDEDRLTYRWDREVNSAYILDCRVGYILKNGFGLAGQYFEYLAYSNSALHEHTFWFMTRFTHPEKGLVTPNSIRESLGDFRGDATLRMPAKYAARLAQAFTATEETVEIYRNEWEEVDDLGPKEYYHTDGVGSISKALGTRIWRKLCDIRRTPQKIESEPSAYQIRFLGYKGVVAVEEELDRSGHGIHMRLRPSMRKFKVKDDERAPMEIAKSFERPGNVHFNHALVMVLEDLGVRKEVFLNLQRRAEIRARTINDSLEIFQETITSHNMGSAFRLREMLEKLRTDYGMDLKSMDNPFWKQIRGVAMCSILRDILFNARVPIPNSYMLVGVADEGPAYEARGYKNVYCLPEGHIFACVQKPTDPEPTWLEGTATISRSPITHIGDVQRVRLIGKPPQDKCFFAHLRNVVVLPSKGNRSLASCLAGGDLDGDEYFIILEKTLLPSLQEDPASYDPIEPKKLDRDCRVEDVCDFIVEYIHSDVIGLLSKKLLVIGDQSIDGMRDLDCQYLAQLCSQAVDYPKRGVPVLLDDRIPKPPIRYKPDWAAASVDASLKPAHYESTRALGLMYQDLRSKVDNPGVIGVHQEQHCTDPMNDSVTEALFPKVKEYLKASAYMGEPSSQTLSLFKRYRDELCYICAVHTLSNSPGCDLSEAEVVIGTILATCPQNRLRRDRMHRMHHHIGTLVQDIKHTLKPKGEGRSIVQALEFAWEAWNFAVHKREEFAANSFGLISLFTVFDCFKDLQTF